MRTSLLRVRSDLLDESVQVVVGVDGQPGGAAHGLTDVVVWLLHGRGAAVNDVVQVLQQVVAPRCTVLAPVGPWLQGGHWWVDSRWIHGAPVERAVVDEVLPAAEAQLGLTATSRVVAGWSMGGAAALRLLLTETEMFGAAVLVAPAAYPTGPPLQSSARDSGAFGVGTTRYEPDRYRSLMGYQDHLAERPETPSARVAILVGDAERPQRFVDGLRSLREDSYTLNRALLGARGLLPTFALLPGAHDVDLWPTALSRGLATVRQG